MLTTPLSALGGDKLLMPLILVIFYDPPSFGAFGANFFMALHLAHFLSIFLLLPHTIYCAPPPLHPSRTFYHSLMKFVDARDISRGASLETSDIL